MQFYTICNSCFLLDSCEDAEEKKDMGIGSQEIGPIHILENNLNCYYLVGL